MPLRKATQERYPMTDLISVIVPVYKVEPYLDACVKSIVQQTYKNLEIILIDDGSPDNCPAMCDAWAQKDTRIKVIHKKNGGQGEARNFGIQAASGEYIGFVDSDDKLHHELYERLHSLLTQSGADAAQCGMRKFTDPAQEVFPTDDTVIKTTVLAPGAAVALLLHDKEITSTCPNTLLKNSLAKKVLFDTGMINEDVMWIYRVLKNAAKTVITNEPLYYYLQRDGSTMNSAYTEKRFDALYALEQRAKEIREDFPALYPVALRSYAGSCMYHYQTLCRLPKTNEYEGFKKRLHKRFCDTDLKTVLSATELKYKIWYTLFRFFPTLTCNLRNILKLGL